MKTVAILVALDGHANSVRTEQLTKFLKNHGYQTEIVNTASIFTVFKHAPFYQLLPIFPLIFLTAFISLVNQLYLTFAVYKKMFAYHTLTLQMKLRAFILHTALKKKNYHAIIVESSYDSYILTKDFGTTITIYDCPTPWGYELFDMGYFKKSQFAKFKELEKKIYQLTDYVCFHWESYTKFIQRNLYRRKNLFIMNFGCTPVKKELQAQYSEKPRIIYVGNLGGDWINLPLLSKLSQKYPIDVYGSPKPDSSLKLNYKGYLKDLSILRNYQFGIITTTKDELRKAGFSAKHTEYLSYGLPVLIPAWRQDKLLDASSIYYDEDNFEEQITLFSNKQNWLAKQKDVLALAKKLEWNNTLQPLLTILNK